MSTWELTMVQGEDWTRVLQVNDQNGNPIPMQAPGFMDIRSGSNRSAARLAHLHSSYPGTGINGSVTVANGQVTLFIPGTWTDGISPGRYFYDLFVTDSTGKMFNLLDASPVRVTARISLPT